MVENEPFGSPMQESEDVNQVLSEINSLRTRNAWIKRGTAIAVVIVVLIYAGLCYRAIRNIDTKVLLQEIAQRSDVMGEVVVQNFAQTLQTVGPKIGNIFLEEFRESYPQVVDTYAKEFADFSPQIISLLSDKVIDSLNAFVKEQEEMLKREFPELKDEKSRDEIYKALDEVFVQPTKDTLLDELREHIEILYDIGQTLELFPIYQDERTDEQLIEELRNMTLRLVELKITKEVK